MCRGQTPRSHGGARSAGEVRHAVGLAFAGADLGHVRCFRAMRLTLARMLLLGVLVVPGILLLAGPAAAGDNDDDSGGPQQKFTHSPHRGQPEDLAHPSDILREEAQQLRERADDAREAADAIREAGKDEAKAEDLDDRADDLEDRAQTLDRRADDEDTPGGHQHGMAASPAVAAPSVP